MSNHAVGPGDFRRTGPRASRAALMSSRSSLGGRLTSRLLSGDPPGPAAVEAARRDVERELAGIEPPQPRTAYAVGGSARSIKRIVGPRLGIDPDRTPTLAAGAVILAAIQERLGAPLKVVRAGLRDGAIADVAARRAAA